MFTIWFLLLIAAIGMGLLLLSDDFRTKVTGFFLSAGSLGVIVIILYITQWNQTATVLY